MADGRMPFEEWLADIRDRNVKAAIVARITRARLGNMGDCKRVGDGVSEMRIHYGPGFRIYFGIDGIFVVILLCGGDKGSQQRDIDKAKLYWDDYRRRGDE